MSNHVAPTVGRVVWYRGKDNLIRAAIVAAVHSQFCINLFAFGATADDSDCGYKTEVTHGDIEHEPSCCPSWSWMPYQKNKANAGQFVSGSVGCGESKLETAQDRVIREKHSLDDNLIRLSQLLQNDKPNFISSDQWWLMQKQESAMKEYSRILGERIILFNAEHEALSPHNTINS